MESNATQNRNSLNDSFLDMFSCTLPEFPQQSPPKRKQVDELPPPQPAKTRNKLSLVKPSQKTQVDGKSSGESTENAAESVEKPFEADADIFCTQILKKIDEESLQFAGKQTPVTVKEDDNLWNNHNLSTLAYQKEIDLIFSRVEHTICELGPAEQHEVSVLDSADWQTLTNTIINMSTIEDANKSLSSVITKALIENAAKLISPKTQINKTFVEFEPVFQRLGGFFGLPEKVKELLKQYRGIEKLYDWQEECLNLPAVENRKNLIYALPTSGGKTLVAEILMLREIMCRKRNAIFILPFVAIVQEKVWALSPFAVCLDFLVEEYASSKGTYPPRKRRRKNSIYIATIEKGLGLINSLYETGRIKEIGLVVIDELHLVGEQGRGATLEALLTKIKQINADIHVVGMSATIGNLKDICAFLNADVYQRNFRPVELIEYVKCGDDIAKINWEAREEELLTFCRKATFHYTESLKKIDPDRLGGLVSEVIPKESCLIFCPSKKSCENVAQLLCKVLYCNVKEYRKNERLQLLSALKDESGSLCEILKVSIEYGVAYHHSGLTNEERRLIEDGFRAGIISVICCTSTLAAGVNLPAKRVILRKPYIGREFINLSRYKQMVGRAGRAGFGETGESILICDTVDLAKVRKLLQSPMDEAVSSLHEGNGKGLRHLLLSCISLGMANTRPELQAVAGKTLMAVQKERLQVDIKKLTDKAITDLFKLGALLDASDTESDSIQNVTLDLNVTCFDPSQNSVERVGRKKKITVTNATKLVVSKLGTAAIKGGFELSRAHVLYEDLLLAQANLVLLTDLHLLFLVIPYDLVDQVKPVMNTYYNIFTKLTQKELHTAKIIGLDESCSVKMLQNRLLKTVPEKIANRFYLTLLLYDLWQEMPIFQAAEKFQVDRGLVQNLMTAAATFAANVVSFCEELGEFWAFVHLLKGMSQKLSHCCVKELIPLMELPSVKQSRARQLYNAGYTTLQKIAKADPENLVQNIEFMSRKVANQLIAAAKMLLLEKVENLKEEAEDVLEGVDEGNTK